MTIKTPFFSLRFARPVPLQLGKKVNKSPLKFALSLASACVTLLINGDEDINPNVSAWVFPVMLVCGGLVMLADWKIRPQNYPAAASTKSEHVLPLLLPPVRGPVLEEDDVFVLLAVLLLLLLLLIGSYDMS